MPAYINLYIFFRPKTESHKILKLIAGKISPNLIWYQFLHERNFELFTVLPKYLNFATFPKDIKQAIKPKLNVATRHKLQTTEVSQISPHFLDVRDGQWQLPGCSTKRIKEGTLLATVPLR